MRTNFNRQARREAMCITTRAPHEHRRERAITPSRVALAASDDLAQVAARIAEELDLSPELADLLAPAPRRGH